MRVDELGSLAGLVLLSRVSSALPPSRASRPAKASECCLVPDLGFP